MMNLFLHRQFILIILLAQLIISCDQKQPADTATVNENITTTVEHISLDTFTTFPPEISGCACYFSNNQEEFRNRIYIYADDYGKNAFATINGVMTKLTVSKTDTLPDNRSVATFVNEDYEITIDVKQVGQMDETWQKEGTMKIKSVGGKVVAKSIYGECGC